MKAGVERSVILSLSKRRSKSRFSPGKIDTSILKRRIFEMLLRPAKILFARFGRRLTIAWINSLCGSVCGKRRIIGFRYAAHSIAFFEGRAPSRPLNLGHDRACASGQMKRYLITGASRGIGRAIAEKLAAPDVTLLVHGRDTIALAKVCKSLEPRCAGVIPLIHDLAVSSGVSDLIAAVGNDPLSLFVNNAGIAVVKPFGEITPIEWEQTLGVNVTAPFLLTQRFSPEMPPGASIVNILSIAAKTGFANWSAYCMSKFALEGFFQSVREELREHKIRVINIYPAAIDTNIWKNVDGD